MKLLLCLSLLTAIATAQTSYTFRRIIDNAPGSTVVASQLPFWPSFSLNDRGDVAFTATVGTGQIAVFVAAPNGTVTRVSRTSDQTPSVLDINNNGVVLYSNLGTIVMWNNGVIDVVREFVPGETAVGLQSASLNDEGAVAIATGARVLIRQGREPLRDLVGVEEVPRSNVFSPPVLVGVSINNTGDVAFAALAGSCWACIYKKAGGRLTQVSPPLATVNSNPRIDSVPAINLAGDVAFYSRVSPRVGYFVGDGGTPRVLVDLSSSRLSPRDRVVAFNNRGQTAFQASGAEGGIYTGPDPVRDRVIAVNSPLFGSTVAAVEGVPFTSGRRLNNRGEILFQYQLSNGVSGLAVASPDSAAGPAPPEVAANGIVNAASFVSADSSPVAPGSLISIFGLNLAPQLSVAGVLPLPDQIQGTRVLVNDVAVPLFFVSPTQINAQLPYNLTPGSVNLRVTTPAGSAASRSIRIAPQTPAVFTLNQSGRGQGIVIFGNSTTLVAPARTTTDSRPARAGDTIVIFANSLGAVQPALPAGWNSCADSRCAPGLTNLTLRRTTLTPRVLLGGVEVPPGNILFSGLAPEFPGLYQINLTIPPGAPRGPAVALTIVPPGTLAADNTVVTLALD